MPKTYGSNADTRYNEWQQQADHNPDNDPADWREVQREQRETDRWFRNRKPLTAAQWAILNQNPWADLS